MINYIKELFEALKEKLQEGGSYHEGEIIGLILSLVASFIFIMIMLFLFN